MAESGQFLDREGTVIDVEQIRTIGKDPKFETQVGRFTIETTREYKDKVYHDYLTFDCKGKVMSSYPDLGDVVAVGFTLSGTKWKNKDGKTVYFNKLMAFKVETKIAGKKASGVRQEDVAFLDDNQSDSDLPF
jgi:hypothetical protein